MLPSPLRSPQLLKDASLSRTHIRPPSSPQYPTSTVAFRDTRQVCTLLPSRVFPPSFLSKVTPPADDYDHWNTKFSTPSYRLPSVFVPPPSRSLEPSPSSSQQELPEDVFASTSYSLDWFGSDSHRSSRFIAEKTCEMICYLWFSTLSNSSSSPSKRNRVASTQHAAFSPHSNSSTALLQFSVSPSFVRFIQKVLETTQVSQSVIVLSLNYIYRLKARNPFTSGQAGSEYRVAIAALMLANKFVDE